VLVLLGRGLRNRKTIARAICPTPIRMDGAPRAQGFGEGREQQIPFGNDNKKGNGEGNSNSRFLRCAVCKAANGLGRIDGLLVGG
jgi:hypothetical protein